MNLDPNIVRIVLMDALYEYVASRGGEAYTDGLAEAISYVEKRYADQGDAWRVTKAAKVAEAKRVAMELRRQLDTIIAAIDPTVDPERFNNAVVELNNDGLADE